jgi:predicted DNA-binding transcriptional regulator AlpA
MSQTSTTETSISGNLDPYRVLPFREWIKLAGVSKSTGWKILHSGKGPKMMWVSERRVGVRVIDHIKWTERLARKAG